MTVGSSTSSSGSGTNSIGQSPDRRVFAGNTENTPLKSASSGLYLKTQQIVMIETCNIDISEDCGFPVTRFNFARRAHSHHMVTGHNASQHNIPKTFTGSSTQNKPLSQQITQPENVTTQFTRLHIANA